MILYFTQEMWLKLQYYVKQCETEISGLGQVEQKGNDFIVTDLVILDQKVSSGTTEIDDQALDKFVFEQTKADTVGKWRLWWHSHAKMTAFFSSIDTDTMDTSTEFDWFISLVTNHKMELEARIDQHKPFRAHKDDLKVEILTEDNNILKEQCLKEIKKHVRQIKTKTKREIIVPAAKRNRQPIEQNEKEETAPYDYIQPKKINLIWKDKNILAVFKEWYEGINGEGAGEWLKITKKDGAVLWKPFHDYTDLPDFIDVKKGKREKKR